MMASCGEGDRDVASKNTKISGVNKMPKKNIELGDVKNNNYDKKSYSRKLKEMEEELLKIAKEFMKKGRKVEKLDENIEMLILTSFQDI